MKSVWVIEDGEYSDYRVVGVFSSKRNAESIQKHVGGTISQWPLNPAVEELSKGYTNWVGEMLYDGTVERMDSTGVCQYSLGGSISVWPRASAPAYIDKGIQDCVHGTVLAKDRKHAIKIFNEHRAQFIASGKLNPPQATR